MRRLALAAALAAAACASAPQASQTQKPIVFARIKLSYEIDVAHAWEQGRNADELVWRAIGVIQRRVDGMFKPGRVRRGKEGLAVLLPEATADQYETFRRIARMPGRLRVAVVDENSPYMQALARRIRDEPRAGVEAGEDRWSEFRRGADHEVIDPAVEHRDIYLAAARADDLATALTELVLRDPLPPDREIVIDEGRHGARTYFIAKGGSLDNTAVESADVRPGWDGRPEVQVVLTAEGRRRFAGMTARAVGRKIVIAVDGVVGTAPIVQEPIANGRLHLMGDVDPDADPASVRRALDDLSAVLRSGPLPAPIVLRRQQSFEHGGPMITGFDTNED
jgi:preprotein translocase subunit SecD